MRLSLIFWVFIIFVASSVIWLISTYNQLVKHRSWLEQTWMKLLRSLKNRHQLISNLLATMQKFSIDDLGSKTINELYITLKNSSESTLDQEKIITKKLNLLFIHFASDQNIQADTNFRELQIKLNEIEVKIQKDSEEFNGVVNLYNTLIKSFPTLYIARNFGFYEAEYYELFDGNPKS